MGTGKLQVTSLGQQLFWTAPGPSPFRETRFAKELADPDRVFKCLEGINWDFDDIESNFLTHDIHPYPAKFTPAIPLNLIAILSLRGELIFDPFGGSGTTALEAVRLGRRCISLDANPLGEVIGRAKTARLTEEDLQSLRALDDELRACYMDLAFLRLDPAALLERHKNEIPPIPNLAKWFTKQAVAELALLKYLINTLTRGNARDVALVAFSRVVMAVSNQESETRYSSKTKCIAPGEAVAAFHRTLNEVVAKISDASPWLRHGKAIFRSGDARDWRQWGIEPGEAALIVTSPPYPNAYDYHLYHRFRLYWLGYNPSALRSVEIGSHLRHQSKKDDFKSYVDEMFLVLQNMYRALAPGRYAAIVIGSGVYGGKEVDTGAELARIAIQVGFEHVGTLTRNLPTHRRSILKAARRLTKESIVILHKPARSLRVLFCPPNYSMWEYEKELCLKEIQSLGHAADIQYIGDKISGLVSSAVLPELRRLAFTREIVPDGNAAFSTWQHLLERNGNGDESSRKEPKYVTHGIHAYKGKFYPQLAKVLINITGLEPGSLVLDPFMGSGTVLLEAYLNGYRGVGMDLNPLAVYITRAKLGILEEDPSLVKRTINRILNAICSTPNPIPHELDQFPESTHEELGRWFPLPVLHKLNFLLKLIRGIEWANIRMFLEVCLSDIIRDVSQQDPHDLRIRRRKTPITDAPVIELFTSKVRKAFDKLQHYWSIVAYSPCSCLEPKIIEGDARCIESYKELGLVHNQVDVVVTSPPYATALPYIDTNRLSILVLFGKLAREALSLEKKLIGSRELNLSERDQLMERLFDASMFEVLPSRIVTFLRDLAVKVKEDQAAGFRRQNLPALLLRYYEGLAIAIRNLSTFLRPGGQIFAVLGNNRAQIGGVDILIDTVTFFKDIALACGLRPTTDIPISVTRDNSRHIKNAIVQNTIVGLVRPM